MKKSIVTSYHSIGFTHFEYLAFIKSNFISVMLVNNILIRMTIKTFFIHESFCIWIDILSKTNQNINAAQFYIECSHRKMRSASQGGMPRPVVHAPVPWLHPHVKTVPKGDAQKHETQRGKTVLQAQTSFAILCFCLQNIFSWTWREIQPSMVTPTRNSCSAFTHPKCTHTAVNTHTHTHTHHTHTHTHTHTRNSTLFCLNTFIFSCKTLFSFAILQFSCKYTQHCFDSILNPPISTTKPTHLHPLDVDPTPPPGSLFCSEGLLKFFCARSLTVPV